METTLQLGDCHSSSHLLGSKFRAASKFYRNCYPCALPAPYKNGSKFIHCFANNDDSYMIYIAMFCTSDCSY
jgi:hypothetical protein